MKAPDNEIKISSNEANFGSKETNFGSKETKFGSKEEPQNNIHIDEGSLNNLQFRQEMYNSSNLINPINESEELGYGNTFPTIFSSFSNLFLKTVWFRKLQLDIENDSNNVPVEFKENFLAKFWKWIHNKGIILIKRPTTTLILIEDEKVLDEFYNELDWVNLAHSISTLKSTLKSLKEEILPNPSDPSHISINPPIEEPVEMPNIFNKNLKFP